MDPHNFGKLDPDPHQSEKQDPDQCDSDPQHFVSNLLLIYDICLFLVKIKNRISFFLFSVKIEMICTGTFQTKYRSLLHGNTYGFVCSVFKCTKLCRMSEAEARRDIRDSVSLGASSPAPSQGAAAATIQARLAQRSGSSIVMCGPGY
jgi:hypothetical protein